MNTILIEKKLQQVTLAHGGHEKRFYLGMSNIGRPDAELLDILTNGSPEPSLADIQRLALGYEAEANVRARLEKANLIKPNSIRELVAFFDPRFKGHTDGEWTDGSLLEIKSTLDKKLDQIERDGKLPGHHYQQMQMYLYHGKYARGFSVYFARDSGRIIVRQVLPSQAVMTDLNNKAKRILREFDRLYP